MVQHPRVDQRVIGMMPAHVCAPSNTPPHRNKKLEDYDWGQHLAND
jgi:hypothetical protein